MCNRHLQPIYLNGSLLYTAHPSNKCLTRGITSSEIKNWDIPLLDLARLQQISYKLTNELIKFNPDIVPIFARGGIPINFSILERLRMLGQSRYLDGKVFHLFPGVSKTWIGLKHSAAYFESEMCNIIASLESPVKIFVVETYYSGTSINTILGRLHRISQSTKKDIYLSMHALVDATKTSNHGKHFITGPNHSVIRVAFPKLFRNNFTPGMKINGITIEAWRYHVARRIIYENNDDLLGASEINRFYSANHVPGTLRYLDEDGNSMGTQHSGAEIDLRFTRTLAQYGMFRTNRKENLFYARLHPRTKVAAYFKWQNSGCPDTLNNWLSAEKELRGH